jgi:hypothetical protein
MHQSHNRTRRHENLLRRMASCFLADTKRIRYGRRLPDRIPFNGQLKRLRHHHLLSPCVKGHASFLADEFFHLVGRLSPDDGRPSTVEPAMHQSIDVRQTNRTEPLVHF